MNVLPKPCEGAGPHRLISFAVQILFHCFYDLRGESGLARRLEGREIVQVIIFIVDYCKTGGRRVGGDPSKYFFRARPPGYIRADIDEGHAPMLCGHDADWV